MILAMTFATLGTDVSEVGDSSGNSTVDHQGKVASAKVWWWLIAPTVDDADLALLDEAELLRLSRMRSPSKAGEFVGSRAAVRRILSELLGTAPELISLGRRPCPGCGDLGHGPPMVSHPHSQLWISLSHTSGFGAFAVADTPVGVDVERLRRAPVDDLAPVALSPAEAAHVRTLPDGLERERAFLSCWTRKEAVLKAVGVGLATELTVLEAHPEFLGSATIRFGVTNTPRVWTVTDLEIPAPWVGSVAVPTHRG